jgi:steroid delta-isomerase-like uncharacterized protein
MNKEHLQILDRFWEAFSAWDVPAAMKLFAQDATYEDLAARHLARGVSEITEFWNSLFANISRQDYEGVRDTVFVACDGHYAVEWTMQFRLEGSFGEVKGSGQKVRFRGASVGRITDGLIVFQRDYWDTGTVLEQLQRN